MRLTPHITRLRCIIKSQAASATAQGTPRYTAIALTVILVAALIIAAFTIAPINPWSASQTLSDQTAGVDTLNLSFDTNIGDVDVVPLQIGDRNILITVVANGSKNALGSSSEPLTLTFDNRTSGGVLTVNSQIRIEDAYASGANVGITIYVDPALKLNLSVLSRRRRDLLGR
jgi:hypothetical protein